MAKRWLAHPTNNLTKIKVMGRTVLGQTDREKNGSFENEALENEDRTTKHLNLENEAPKTRKRSTQNSKPKQAKIENEAPKTRKRSTQKSKTKHPKLETCLSFKNTRQSLVKSPMLTQQKSSTITNRDLIFDQVWCSKVEQGSSYDS